MAMTERYLASGATDGTPSDGSSMQESALKLSQNVQRVFMVKAAELRTMREAGGADYDAVAVSMGGINAGIKIGEYETDSTLIVNATTAEQGQIIGCVYHLEHKPSGNRIKRALRKAAGKQLTPVGRNVSALSPYKGDSIAGELGIIYRGTELGRNADQFFMQVIMMPEGAANTSSLGFHYEFYVPMEQMTGLEVTVKDLPQAPATPAPAAL